jgi:lipoate-protein ligase A
MKIKLRVIQDGPHTAAFNMAADMYLLKKCLEDQNVCLRIYSWQPSAISIGYMQNAEQVLNLKSCIKNGIDWIKRPTGGRAVYHCEDLSYSCVFSLAVKMMGSSIHESYSIISDCLMNSFRLCNIDTSPHDSDMDARDARREIKLPCFLSPNRRELMVGNRKLAGSAQKRTSGAVLQHGSIPLTPAFRNLPDFENINDDEKLAQKDLLEKKCACISEIAPDCKSWQLEDALAEGFGKTLGMEVVFDGWSEKEREEIEMTEVSFRSDSSFRFCI